MKTLFWILAVLMIPVGLFVTIFSWFVEGLGLYGTLFGQIISYMGIAAVVISIVCAVIGIKKLRKGDVKKGGKVILAGLAFCVVIVAGFVIDELVDTMQLKRSIAEYNEQTYGENWDAAPAIDGIPELYQEVLNKFYVAVGETWPSDQLMDLAAVSMAGYYGDAPLDNIGFAVMDVNGDGVVELLIGTTAPVEEGGTAVFCMYSDPENPFTDTTSMEGEIYYLHAADGTYIAEIGGANAYWVFMAKEGQNIVDSSYQEGALDASGRLTLDMIAFSQYK